jgi:hypothetical protein
MIHLIESPSGTSAYVYDDALKAFETQERLSAALDEPCSIRQMFLEEEIAFLHDCGLSGLPRSIKIARVGASLRWLVLSGAVQIASVGFDHEPTAKELLSWERIVTA